MIRFIIPHTANAVPDKVSAGQIIDYVAVEPVMSLSEITSISWRALLSCIVCTASNLRVQAEKGAPRLPAACTSHPRRAQELHQTQRNERGNSGD